MEQNVEGVGEFKNQPAYDKNGKFIGWISRAIACLNMVFGYDDNMGLYVLASQRGKGTPDPELVGSWNCVTGYLDYGETTAQAAIRETREETGIEINENDIYRIGINDDPNSDKRQNIGFRFVSILPNNIDTYTFNKDGNEKDEVDDIKFININDIDNYKWAFNHNEILKETVKNIFDLI
jgi:8-oxo-dGTP diphosphatase